MPVPRVRCPRRLCRLHHLGLLSLLLGLAAPRAWADVPSPDAEALCLVGGQIVDPDQRTITRRDLRISQGQITAIVAPGACEGQRLDAGGRFVLPGLIDLHVHGWGNPSPTDAGEDDVDREGVLARILRAGVMATLDLAGDDSERIPLRDRLRHSPDHAALYVGSALFAGAPREGRAPPSEDELRARVRTRIARRPDVIKIIDAGGPIATTIDEARRAGLSTIVHISRWEHARDAVDAGATAITHFEDEVTIPADLVTAWAAKGIQSIPTMAVQCDVHRIVADPGFLTDPLLVQMTTPALRAAYRDRTHWDDKARYWARWQKAGCEPHDFVTLRRLHAAGVPLLAGSDTGNLGTFQGFSLHRELALMAAAGVPAWEVLRAATTNAAAFLRIPWGVKAGDPANLLLLDRSPVPDVRNTRRIVQVIYRGRVLPAPGGGPKPRSAAPMSGAAK